MQPISIWLQLKIHFIRFPDGLQFIKSRLLLNTLEGAKSFYASTVAYMNTYLSEQGK